MKFVQPLHKRQLERNREMGRLGMLRYHATPSTPSRSVWWAQAGRKQGASMAQLWALSCGLEWVAGVSHGGVGAARRVDRRRFSVRTPPPPPPGPLRYAPVPNPCFQLRCRVHHFVLLSGVVRCGLAKINGKIGKQRLSGLLGRKGAHYGGPVTGKSPGVTGFDPATSTSRKSIPKLD